MFIKNVAECMQMYTHKFFYSCY